MDRGPTGRIAEGGMEGMYRHRGRHEVDLADGAACQPGHKVLLELLVVRRGGHGERSVGSRGGRCRGATRCDAMAWRWEGGSLPTQGAGPGIRRQVKGQSKAGASRVFVCGRSCSGMDRDFAWGACFPWELRRPEVHVAYPGCRSPLPPMTAPARPAPRTRPGFP